MTLSGNQRTENTIERLESELRAIRTELETSKDDRQSVNEILATISNRFQHELSGLSAAYSELTNVMAAMDIATLFLDTELRIRLFTPVAGRLFNLCKTDISQPLRNFAGRFTNHDFSRDARRVLETLTTSEKEISSDEGRWYLQRIRPCRTRDRQLCGIVITLIDTTARVADEVQSRCLATVLRDSNDAVIVSTPDGRITTWNRGAELAYGYSESEALEMDIRAIIPEMHRRSVTQIAERAARGEDIEPFETQRTTRDGRLLDVWVTLTALKDPRGRIVALARTERDVTAWRAAEVESRRLNAELEQRVTQRTAALEGSESRMRAILDAAVDAIISIDAAGTIETFNSAAERMFGYLAAETIGQNVSMLMASPYREQHDEYLRRYRTTREPRVIGKVRDFWARRKDGTEFPIQLSVSDVTSFGFFTGFVRDMTEQRELQEEIVRVATVEQRRIGQELHDSTLQELAGLGLLAQNLADGLNAPEFTHECQLATRIAVEISETNQRVRFLAEGLVPVAVDAEGLMAALASLAERTVNKHGVSCAFVCPEPVRLTDDRTALHIYRIVQEAVVNAIKHAKANEILICLERTANGVQVDVCDDGIGIESERQNCGLGLRIMQHRAGVIGGTFSARKREAGGTVISCSVPAFPARTRR